MSPLNLSQRWVDKVTADAGDAPSVIGPDQSSPRNEHAVEAILERHLKTDAVSEMIRRKWFVPREAQGRRDRLPPLKDFLFSHAAHRPAFAAVAHFRRQGKPRALADEIATFAWLCRITDKAADQTLTPFDSAHFGPDQLSTLVRLSGAADAPARAIAYLQQLGIRVVLESSLPGMRTDGASLRLADGNPLIGLTLRLDRLDSFWFTLLHELAHILLHLSHEPRAVFVDLIDEDPMEAEVEAEADAFAKDAFIPRDAWLRSEAFRTGKEPAIASLAAKFHIHPAIVAGRLRFERKQFHLYSNLVGVGEVRNRLLAG